MGVLLGMSEYIILIQFDSVVYICLVGNGGFWEARELKFQ